MGTEGDKSNQAVAIPGDVEYSLVADQVGILELRFTSA
jgi:hypothetical protein